MEVKIMLDTELFVCLTAEQAKRLTGLRFEYLSIKKEILGNIEKYASRGSYLLTYHFQENVQDSTKDEIVNFLRSIGYVVEVLECGIIVYWG